MTNLADEFVRFLAASKEGRFRRWITPHDPCSTKIDPAPVFWIPPDLHIATIAEGRSKFTVEQAEEMLAEAKQLMAEARLTLPYRECFIGCKEQRWTMLACCQQHVQGGKLSVDCFTELHSKEGNRFYVRGGVMMHVYKEGDEVIQRGMPLFGMTEEVYLEEENFIGTNLRTVMATIVMLSRQHEIRISDIDPPTNRYLARNSTRKPLQRMVEVDLSRIQWRMRYDPKEHPSGRVQSPHDRRGHVRHHRGAYQLDPTSQNQRWGFVAALCGERPATELAALARMRRINPGLVSSELS